MKRVEIKDGLWKNEREINWFCFHWKGTKCIGEWERERERERERSHATLMRAKPVMKALQLVLWEEKEGETWRLKGREAIRLEPPLRPFFHFENLVVCCLYGK